ncbi:hypothetical protein VA596_24900 [Amycolatopsis sp., V23-08]|uniref:Uncharacterized protein n=1 Tax=Amycolatopsis heterodermiae TaxID=3110235 RepID=A0ABU5R976_9PSEU|nr:hypothetical protein [Amycolatopsis sp., V23-08]MEA5362797.1 hypothetical protein [Amycolatopsis sp., V23-08]
MHPEDALADEVQAAVSAAIGTILKEEDPVKRYQKLGHQLTVYDHVVTRIADEKAQCATDLASKGESFARVAGLLSVGTRSRAQQLVGRGRRQPVIFAFRDQDGEIYGDHHLLATMPHDEARLQFEPADRDLFFAGQQLQVYFGHVHEDTVTPSLYTYTTVDATTGERRVRPTQRVHDILFGIRTDR